MMAEHKKETKELILNTAREVFAELGYEGARVDMIAERAGINKAGIYYHIGGKQKLYEAVLKNTFKNIFDYIIEGVEKKDSPNDKLRFYTSELLKSIEQYSYIPPIMIREIASGGKNISKPLSIEFSKIITCITKILAQGEKEGVFIKTSPSIIHFMVVSTNAYMSLLSSGQGRESNLTKEILNENIDSKARREEIEKLVLRAVLANNGGNKDG